MPFSDYFRLSIALCRPFQSRYTTVTKNQHRPKTPLSAFSSPFGHLYHPCSPYSAFYRPLSYCRPAMPFHVPPDYPKSMSKSRFQVLCNQTRTSWTGSAGFCRSFVECLALTSLLVIRRRKPSFGRPGSAAIRSLTVGRDSHFTIRSHSNGDLHQPEPTAALEHRRWTRDAIAFQAPPEEETGRAYRAGILAFAPGFLAQQKP